MSQDNTPEQVVEQVAHRTVAEDHAITVAIASLVEETGNPPPLCPQCNGAGVSPVLGVQCHTCHGQGVILKAVTEPVPDDAITEDDAKLALSDYAALEWENRRLQQEMARTHQVVEKYLEQSGRTGLAIDVASAQVNVRRAFGDVDLPRLRDAYPGLADVLWVKKTKVVEKPCSMSNFDKLLAKELPDDRLCLEDMMGVKVNKTVQIKVAEEVRA